jgi:hypothetical protein
MVLLRMESREGCDTVSLGMKRRLMKIMFYDYRRSVAGGVRTVRPIVMKNAIHDIVSCIFVLPLPYPVTCSQSLASPPAAKSTP